MAIDTNDIKILIHSSLEILMKSCWQCLKDHPIVSVVLLVFLSLYIFIPSLFYLLFYTSPLVICTIILVQGHSQSSHQNIRTDKPESQSSHGASSRRPRPSIQATMSRRTFKKRTCEELGTILMEDLKVDFVIRSFSNDIPMKPRDEKVSIEPQKDDKFIKPKLPVVECCNEEDQTKDMDLGLSELERNKRLESLIAKRRARKMFNMNVHRINPLNPVANNDLIPPINTERNTTENEGGQPGSAPSVLGPTNPFDLPYDPSEEKPVLTGDGFAEEMLITQPKDMHYCRHESFTYGPSFFTDYFDHLHSKSRVSVFTNPTASMAPGLPKSRRYSDAGGSLWRVPEKPSGESENVNQTHQVQTKKTQSNHHEEDVSPNCEYTDTILLESRDATKEQEPVDNTLAMESTEINQDLIDDDNDDTSSLSSLETSADFAKASDDVTIAVKNENFRNSVKKVLAVIQKNRASAFDNEDISPSPAHRTKMEERALYTRPSHHPSYSLASDMQVEFSDGPNSPTDVESLVFDRDEDEGSQGSVELEEQGTRSRTQLECSQESLNNFDDFNVESSQAEGDMVQTSNILPVDDHQHEEYNHKNAAMVGSASTSTEQNIDTYIHLPSSNSNDPTIQNQNHNSHDPISSSSPTSVLQETITMADNQGSIHAGSTASPRSVLPETILVRELAPSRQDNQPPTPDEEASTFLNEEESKEMVHEPTNL